MYIKNFIVFILVIFINSCSLLVIEDDSPPPSYEPQGAIMWQPLKGSDSKDPDKCKEHTLEELKDWDIEITDDCYIKWVDAVTNHSLSPDNVLKGETEESNPDNIIEEDSVIIFQPGSSVGDVIFQHAIHTFWLGCNGCHYGRRIFIPMRGANKITMRAIAKGEYCGVCHGIENRSASFDMSNVSRCPKCHIKLQRDSN